MMYNTDQSPYRFTGFSAGKDRMTAQPNFSRFRTAVLSQGEPDRVPLAEASIDLGIPAGA